MIMTMRQGKQNQHGKIEYMGCMRNLDPILCPLSALAFYFFNRWGRHGAQPFPSFRQPEDYYGQYVFPGSVRVTERPLSYATQLDWSKKTPKPSNKPQPCRRWWQSSLPSKTSPVAGAISQAGGRARMARSQAGFACSGRAI